MEKISFVQGPGEPLPGTLEYSWSEYSFDFTPELNNQLWNPLGHDGTASLSIGTLQIAIDVESGRCLYAWGLHSYHTWESSRLAPPPLTYRSVEVVSNDRPVGGTTYELAALLSWKTSYDNRSGWVLVENPGRPHDETVEICDAVALSLSNNALTGVWMHPNFIS